MRLLMLGCSERKVGTCGRLPAFQRYDGPAYRVYRKFLRDDRDADSSVGSLYSVREIRVDFGGYTDPRL